MTRRLFVASIEDIVGQSEVPMLPCLLPAGGMYDVMSRPASKNAFAQSSRGTPVLTNSKVTTSFFSRSRKAFTTAKDGRPRLVASRR